LIASCRCTEDASPGCVHLHRRPETSSRIVRSCINRQSWQRRQGGCLAVCRNVCILSKLPSQGRSDVMGPEGRHACCDGRQHTQVWQTGQQFVRRRYGYTNCADRDAQKGDSIISSLTHCLHPTTCTHRPWVGQSMSSQHV
jgi:hypothetical protein